MTWRTKNDLDFCFERSRRTHPHFLFQHPDGETKFAERTPTPRRRMKNWLSVVLFFNEP
jgi:hypothetical protein